MPYIAAASPASAPSDLAGVIAWLAIGAAMFVIGFVLVVRANRAYRMETARSATPAPDAQHSDAGYASATA